MKTWAFAVAVLAAVAARGHDLADEPGYAAARLAPERAGAVGVTPGMAAAFGAFKDHTTVRWDERWLYVESDGMPAHRMMVGITAWQQQVPLPQAYVGENAWRIPLHPVVAKEGLSAKTHFFRGAIAVAVNGVPIFNPIKNDGRTDTFLAGELDEFGGHSGRADDYHYHVAPLHLQKVVGMDRPIAYALDGYAIYGLNEPGGGKVGTLDAFNGHVGAKGEYHYHATKAYPYVNGGFHGEVVERGGQVDPQPRAEPVREAGRPLRGAKVTGFKFEKPNVYSLVYEVGGKESRIDYRVEKGGLYRFDYVEGGKSRTETYRGREGLAAKEPFQSPTSTVDSAGETPASRGLGTASKGAAKFALESPAVKDGKALPKEFTGDGEGVSPPVKWEGEPEGTKGYAVVMHHIDPEGKVKWYWVVWDIPADVHELPRDVKGVGKVGGNSVNRKGGYAPPHSKGPGVKEYVLTVYALSAPAEVKGPEREVSREALLEAIKDRTLGSAELHVTYDRTGLTQ